VIFGQVKNIREIFFVLLRQIVFVSYTPRMNVVMNIIEFEHIMG